ncbi:MAG TPA: alpha-amylase family glycosyl hydrolase, partial [Methylibium sp.]
VAYHEDSLRFWLNRGVDGFRLDAVPHMIENGPKDWNDQPESRALTGELRKLITGYARHYVVCEATANPQAYAAPEVCGSAFAFGGHGSDIVEAAKGKPEAIRAVADYFKTAPASMATMVSNHDIFAGQRLWDQVGGDVAQYKLAAATYLLQPGTPFIYYGEEIGMGGVNSLPGDEPLRSPMSWSADANSGFTSGQPFRPLAPNAATHNAAAEQADPHSLLAFYKNMLRLRNTLPSIAQGSYEAAQVEGQTLSYQRKFKREHSVVLLNYGTEPAELTVPGLHAGARLKSAYPRGWKSLKADRQGVVRVRMPAQSVRVLVVQR